jgi:hypothetical protein
VSGTSTTLLCFHSISVVDQDITHGLGGETQKVLLVVDHYCAAVTETKVSLADELGGLEEVTPLLTSHPPAGDSMQLGIKLLEQLRRSRGIAHVVGMDQGIN